MLAAADSGTSCPSQDTSASLETRSVDIESAPMSVLETLPRLGMMLDAALCGGRKGTGAAVGRRGCDTQKSAA